MKAVMISKKPKECMNILNLIQSLIVSKTCPKDWKDYICGKTNIKPEPMIVFIHCNNTEGQAYLAGTTIVPNGFKKNLYLKEKKLLNGKVVAKFTLNKMELVSCCSDDFNKIIKASSCITMDDLINYCEGKDLYAWYIDNLVIFNEPKELSEFMVYRWNEVLDKNGMYVIDHKFIYKPLTKAPQSWCYVEVNDKK